MNSFDTRDFDFEPITLEDQNIQFNVELSEEGRVLALEEVTEASKTPEIDHVLQKTQEIELSDPNEKRDPGVPIIFSDYFTIVAPEWTEILKVISDGKDIAVTAVCKSCKQLGKKRNEKKGTFKITSNFITHLRVTCL